MTLFTSFLDNVDEPHNFNPVGALFDFLVTELFLKLDSTTSENKAPFTSVSAKKVHIIEQFVASWRKHFGNNIYPAIRLIFPNRDDRKYNIKDVALTRLVIKLLRIQPGLSDHVIIKNWKKSYHQKSQLVKSVEKWELSDLPLIIARIILRRRDQNKLVKTSVTVADVNEVLDKLTHLTHANDQIEILSGFLDRLTIPEVRCFFQIILKESMLSSFERSFFEAWHPDAFDLFKVCEDMKKIFWLLHDSSTRLTPNQLCVQPMYAFIPQSSKKLELSYNDLCGRMCVPMSVNGKDARLVQMYNQKNVEGNFLIEEKIDGDRMLMHMVDGVFKWHTRRRRDYTMVYGENVHIGLLTKHLVGALHENVSSIVLDGEMVAWSKDRELILPFGTLRSAAVQDALKQFEVVDVYEGNNSWPLFLIFDILHLNGQNLTNLPLFYRKDLLNKVIKEVPHRFEILQWVMASTADDIKANMRRIVADRNEGIMVKSLLLKYRVYSRDSTWVKVKPEYLENFGENLDLVVIGKIGRIKTSYICGLKDIESGSYKLFCRVANGFLTAIYRQIESRLYAFWVDYQLRPPDAHVMQFGSVKPDFWIDPANLIVLEIKARSIEVTTETLYAAGSTLHNLWCRAVRDDKTYDECITLQEYWELRTRYLTDIFKHQTVNRSRKRAYENSIYGNYDRKLQRRSPKRSSLFKDIYFVVATDYRDDSGEWFLASQIKALIVENGGKIESNPKREELFHERTVVLAQGLTPRTRRWISEGFDIINPRWVVYSVRDKFLYRFESQFVEASQRPTCLESRVDSSGDSYTVTGRLHPSILCLPHLLAPNSFELCADQNEEKQLRSLFLGRRFFLVFASAARSVALARKISRFGGDVTSSAEGATYVVGDYDEVNQVMKEIGRHYNENIAIPKVVTSRFIFDSVAKGEIVDSEAYLPLGKCVCTEQSMD